MTQFVNETGAFTEDFTKTLPTILGDEHKDFKGFEGVKDVQTLAKMYADTKSAYGKKLDNVIQKPGKDAKPEDIQAYQKNLLGELGGIKSPDDLKDVNWRAGIKEGVAIDENLVKGLSDFAAKKGYPKSFIKELVEEFYNPVMMASFEQQQQAQAAEEKRIADEQAAFRKSHLEAIEKEMPGDARPEKLRNVLKVVEFIGNDDLKAKIKAGDLYNNPTVENFEKAGINIENILPFAKLSGAIDTAKLIGNPAGGGNKDPNSFEARLAKAKQDYPGAEHMWPRQ